MDQTACECHSALHPVDGCGQPAAGRWFFHPEQVYTGEPGHIDLCAACRSEWLGYGLSPRREELVPAEDTPGGPPL